MLKCFLRVCFDPYRSVAGDPSPTGGEKKMLNESIDEAAVSLLVGQRLKDANAIDKPRNALECFQLTEIGCRYVFKSKNDRARIKNRISRASKRPLIKQLSDERYEQQRLSDGVQSVSEPKGMVTRQTKTEMNRERYWNEVIELVRGKHGSEPWTKKRARNHLKNKHRMKVTEAHIDKAVKAKNRGTPTVTYAAFIDPRGAKTKLSAEAEEALAALVRQSSEQGHFMHWSCIVVYADGFFRKENGMEQIANYAADDCPPLAFNHSWYQRFLARHKLRTVGLKFQDEKRTNSATEKNLFDNFVCLAETGENMKLGKKSDAYNRDVEGSIFFEWFPDMLHRVWFGDETSVNLELLGSSRFKFVAAVGKAAPAISVPNPQFRASIMGVRNLEGDSLAPMIVTQKDYKFKEDCDGLHGTVMDTNTNMLQRVRWAFNDKGSFDEDHFCEFLEHHLAPCVPDLSPENPALFVVDGVRTHMTSKVLRTAWQLGIRLFVLPPNCTHLLQCADLVNFPVLKGAFTKELLNYVTSLSFTAGLLQSAYPDDAPSYQRSECLYENFAAILAKAWPKAFHRKEINRAASAAAGVYPFTMKPLDKWFPRWREVIFKENISAIADQADATTPSPVECVRERIVSGRLFHDSTMSETAEAVDGSPSGLRRVKPMLDAIEKMEAAFMTFPDLPPSEQDAVRAASKVALASLKKTVLSVVLKDAQRRRRNTAGRGALTLQDLLDSEARDAARAPDPERAAQKARTSKRREDYVASLEADITAGRYLKYLLTRAELADIIYTLRARDAASCEPVRPVHSPDDLRRMLAAAWPEFAAFENSSRLEGARERKRGPRAQRRVEIDSDTEEDDDSEEDDEHGPVNDAIGGAACGNDEGPDAESHGTTSTRVVGSVRTRTRPSELSHECARRSSTRARSEPAHVNNDTLQQRSNVVDHASETRQIWGKRKRPDALLRTSHPSPEEPLTRDRSPRPPRARAVAQRVTDADAVAEADVRDQKRLRRNEQSRLSKARVRAKRMAEKAAPTDARQVLMTITNIR